MNILNMNNKELTQLVLEHVADEKREQIARWCAASAKQYRSNGAYTADCDLAAEWYASVAAGAPAFSIYERAEYIAEAMTCFLYYSKQMIKRVAGSQLAELFSPGDVILDLGCGVGLTCAYLKAHFPHCTVIGTQMCGHQHMIATQLAQRFDFRVVEYISDISHADIIFASEYFEHFAAPIAELLTTLALDPSLYVINNAFGGHAAGHFPEYLAHSSIIDNKRIGRAFNAALRLRGFEQMALGFYNSRPTVWRRRVSSDQQLFTMMTEEGQ